MRFAPWEWLRQRVRLLALSKPRLTTGLVFFFLYTTSNYVHFTTDTVLPVSPFWHMVIMGALVATFASLLFYEVILLHRRLAEVQIVSKAALTVRSEINNSLTVILLSAQKLQTSQVPDERGLQNILSEAAHIERALTKLSELEQEVRYRKETGLQDVIDIGQSR